MHLSPPPPQNHAPGRIRRTVTRAGTLCVVWLALLALACVVGYFLVGPSGQGASKSFDLSVAQLLARNRPVGLAGASGVLPDALLAMFGAWVLALLIRSHKVSRPEAVNLAVAVGASAAGAYALSTAVKEIFTRSRPPRVLAAIGDTGFSFPSSHSTVGLALVASLLLVATKFVDGRMLRALRASAIVLAVIIPASRLALGVHWTTDVVVGGLLGAAWGAFATRLWLRPLPVRSARAVTVRRRIAAGSSALLFVVLAPPAWSYVGALRYPGSADVGMRTTDWLRREGAGPIVNWIENFRYARHPSSVVNPVDATHPFQGTSPMVSGYRLPPPVAVPVAARAVGAHGHDPAAARFNGKWVAVRNPRPGPPALYTADWIPDPSLPGVSVAGIWMNKSLVRPQLVAGTREPGGSGWPWNAQIPPALRTRVVAAFNGGFRLREANGGFMVNGRVGVPLRSGAASLVIHRNGSVDIGSWNRGVRQDGTVVAVRQNLKLIVEHGKPVAGLRVNAFGAWGSVHNQLQYTWRSGLGVDAHGNMVYVAGGGLNLQTLATALSEAGAVRGMELEMHYPVVTCNLYEPVPGHANTVVARKLLPNMAKPATRYLKQDQRDFIAILARTP